MITGSARGTVHHTVPGAETSITSVPRNARTTGDLRHVAPTAITSTPTARHPARGFSSVEGAPRPWML